MYIINGNKKLNGIIKINGSKNSSLAIIIAALICQDEVVLENVPSILDVANLLEILTYLNCIVYFQNNKLYINSQKITYKTLLIEEVGKFRASYYFMGAFLALFGKVRISKPGGCKIGSRPINYHLKGLKDLNMIVEESETEVFIRKGDIEETTLCLDFPSVGATVNLILASLNSYKKIIIKNAAKEPEIIDLVNFLNHMGANIYGAEDGLIVINQIANLRGVTYKIMPDRIESGTYIIYAAALAEKMTIEGINTSDLISLINVLVKMNIKMDIRPDKITIYESNDLKNVRVETGTHPQFPTDLQQIMCTLLTKVKHESIIVETIFDNRYTHIDELKKLKCRIIICDNKLIICHTENMYGNILECKDLRGGASQLLGCLMAKGTSILKNTEFIERGYQDLVENLKKLGADIERIDENEN